MYEKISLNVKMECETQSQKAIIKKLPTFVLTYIREKDRGMLN